MSGIPTPTPTPTPKAFDAEVEIIKLRVQQAQLVFVTKDTLQALAACVKKLVAQQAFTPPERSAVLFAVEQAERVMQTIILSSNQGD